MKGASTLAWLRVKAGVERHGTAVSLLQHESAGIKGMDSRLLWIIWVRFGVQYSMIWSARKISVFSTSSKSISGAVKCTNYLEMWKFPDGYFKKSWKRRKELFSFSGTCSTQVNSKNLITCPDCPTHTDKLDAILCTAEVPVIYLLFISGHCRDIKLN